jgi:hypothetical protein
VYSKVTAPYGPPPSLSGAVVVDRNTRISSPFTVAESISKVTDSLSGPGEFGWRRIHVHSPLSVKSEATWPWNVIISWVPSSRFGPVLRENHDTQLATWRTNVTLPAPRHVPVRLTRAPDGSRSSTGAQAAAAGAEKAAGDADPGE